MTDKTKQLTHPNLYGMPSDEIALAALSILDALLQRCTIHMVTELTSISRATIYKWLNEDIELEKMSPRDCAWFILVCETDPRIIMLLQRGPFSHTRLAKRWLESQPIEGTK